MGVQMDWPSVTDVPTDGRTDRRTDEHMDGYYRKCSTAGGLKQKRKKKPTLTSCLSVFGIYLRHLQMILVGRDLSPTFL